MQYDIHPVTGIVNQSAYMDFKKATDTLFDRVGHSELAEEIGASVASIRQARLKADTAAHRTAPAGWESAVAKLAEARAKRLLRLAEQLRAAT